MNFQILGNYVCSSQCLSNGIYTNYSQLVKIIGCSYRLIGSDVVLKIF